MNVHFLKTKKLLYLEFNFLISSLSLADYLTELLGCAHYRTGFVPSLRTSILDTLFSMQSTVQYTVHLQYSGEYKNVLKALQYGEISNHSCHRWSRMT